MVIFTNKTILEISWSKKKQVYHSNILTIDISEELFMKFWPETEY